MHVFLADRSPPLEGPLAAEVRRKFRAFVAQRAGKAERHRDIAAILFERSRQTIAQSLGVLAKVPDRMKIRSCAETSEGRPMPAAAAPDHPSRWQGLMVDGVGDRFFFDIDDGYRIRRDEVGMVLPSQDDVERESKAILFDLAFAETPFGRLRIFSAKVRDASGVVIYTGSPTMEPFPNA